jgi:hypothetical protein
MGGDVNSMMKIDERRDANAVEAACLEIILDHPEAIGVAYKGLDCGCALICGVSAKGQPLGAMRHVSGQPASPGGRPPICLRCKMDDGLARRVIAEGIYWPGGRDELPDPDLRLRIGRQVFGEGYGGEG